ncbi:MAG: hypothetical protein K2M87_03960 [Muribaculaceae bacterium]|nr:hypothetical protein [Muribaculaceae bacterium]
MKRHILLFLVMILACGTGFTQTKKPECNNKVHKEIREFKMKYMAQEMKLKADQQKQFIEVYGDLEDERHNLYHETRKLERSLRDDKNATEADYEAVSNAITKAKEKDAEIEKKYDARFAKFLSAKQIFKMKSAEENFRRKMHEMRHAKKSSKQAKKNKKK